MISMNIVIQILIYIDLLSLTAEDNEEEGEGSNEEGKESSMQQMSNKQKRTYKIQWNKCHTHKKQHDNVS